MAYVALYRAYRPQSFKEVSGQEHIVKTLQNAIINKKVAHAYLFSGPRGTGKTSIAKIIAKAVNCQNPQNGEPCNECDICRGITRGIIPDVVEIDAASNNGVDEIREIRDKVKYMPTEGKYKVYIIDEVHMLSTGAFNALLKTLEEPPAHAIFILATTEVHKIPATILSRCQRFDFRAIGEKEIKERIQYICNREQISIDDEAIQLIAECAEGGMRDALSLLDEAVSFGGNKVELDDVYQVSGSINYNNMIELVTSILEKDSAKVLQTLDDIMELGKEVPKICTDLIGFYRDMLLYKNNPNGDKAINRKLDFQRLAKSTSNQRIYFYLNILNETQNNMRYTNQKRTYLELGLVKMSDYVEQIKIDNQEEILKLNKRIDQLESQIKGNANNQKVSEAVLSQQPITLQQDSAYRYITIQMVETILNNGNAAKKKTLQVIISNINTRSDKMLLQTLQSGNVVAFGNDEAIITFDSDSICDYMMQIDHKAKALNMINKNEKIIKNYLALPASIWNAIYDDYRNQYYAGNKKPKLAHINIGVRLYDEVETNKPSEMEIIAKEMFGDLIEFEE